MLGEEVGSQEAALAALEASSGLGHRWGPLLPASLAQPRGPASHSEQSRERVGGQEAQNVGAPGPQ